MVDCPLRSWQYVAARVEPDRLATKHLLEPAAASDHGVTPQVQPWWGAQKTTWGSALRPRVAVKPVPPVPPEADPGTLEKCLVPVALRRLMSVFRGTPEKFAVALVLLLDAFPWDAQACSLGHQWLAVMPTMAWSLNWAWAGSHRGWLSRLLEIFGVPSVAMAPEPASVHVGLELALQLRVRMTAEFVLAE